MILLSIETFTAVYFQSLFSLLGALGGALSLYLGIAVAMLFEFLELCLDLLEVAYSSRTNKM